MTPEQWRRAREVFHQVVDLPPADRPALVAELCPDDPDAAQRILSMCGHDDRLGDETERSSPDGGEVAAPACEPGTLLAGRFAVEQVLGGGAFGDVYGVFDQQRQARVALKVLRSWDPEALLRFKREFRRLAEIHHPNIVALHELVSEGGRWMYTMEWIAGVHFLDYVRTAGGFSEIRLRGAMRQLAGGLAHLHQHGLLHRDVKPSNVLVDADGRVVLLDFGLIREKTIGAPGRSFAGTIEYMAPEQALAQEVTEASDWYGAGVMLYRALSGELPHRGSQFVLLTAKLNETPPPPSAHNPQAPADLDQLCMSMLERDAARRPSAQSILAAFDAAAVAPPAAADEFYGREGELATLAEAWRRALAGQFSVARVCGASGIGKSSLLNRFLEEAARIAPTALVLRGRCFAREAVPYQGIDDLVDNLARELSHLAEDDRQRYLPDQFDVLIRVFPVLHRLAHVRPTRISDPIELRRRALRSMREMLARVAEHRGLVVALDDWQWAGEDSNLALRELLDPVERPVGLFVLASREADTASWLEGQAGLRSIRLEAFGTEAARGLAEYLGADYDRPEVLRSLADESGGDPFLLKQAIHSLRSAPGGEVTLDGLLQRRILALGERPRYLLELTAVSGRPVEAEVLSEIQGPPEWTLAALHELAAQRLVRIWDANGSRLAGVYHDRAAAAVSALISPERLAGHHLRLAEAIEKRRPDDAGPLAYHFEQAGAGARAVPHVLAAADRAAAALAFERAAQLCRLALDLEAADAGQRFRAWYGLGQALLHRGRGHEAAGCLQEAARLAAPGESLRIRSAAANQLFRSGHLEEGERLLGEVLREARLPAPATRRGLFLAIARERLGHRMQGWLGGGDPVRSPERMTEIDICSSAAIALSMVSPLRSALYSSRFVRLAARCGDEYREALALAGEATQLAHGARRRAVRSWRLLEEAQLRAEYTRDHYALGFVRLMAGIVSYLQGDWEDSVRDATHALEVFQERCTGVAWEVATANNISFSSRAALGRLRVNAACLGRLLADAEERGDVYGSAGMRIQGLTYMCDLLDDQPERALRELQDALASFRGAQNDIILGASLLGRVDIALYTGDLASAHEYVERNWAAVERSGVTRIPVSVISCHGSRARLHLALAAQRPRERNRLLARVRADAAHARRMGFGFGPALAETLLAGIASINGDRSSTIALLKSAEAKLGAARIVPFQMAVRYRLASLETSDSDGCLRLAREWFQAEGGKRLDLIADTLVPGVWPALK